MDGLTSKVHKENTNGYIYQVHIVNTPLIQMPVIISKAIHIR